MGSSQSGPHKHGANRDGTASPPNAGSGSTTIAAGSSSGRDGGTSTSPIGGASGSTTARGRPGAADKAAEPPKDEGNKALAATLYPQDARVDNGHLLPLSNIYPSSPQDWLHDIVQKLIIDRKLAPFYRGLDDWDEDDYDKEECNTALDNVGDEQAKKWRTASYSDDDRMAEAAMYKKAAECPICFLYYPPLINTSRCCDQPICTECFVQIKRAEPTTSNLSSEPAACPFCVEPNFGVMYAPPPMNRRDWAWLSESGKLGLGSSEIQAASSNMKGTSKRDKTPEAPPLERSRSSNSTTSETDMGPAAKAHARRKSVSHTSAEVVTVDYIQADWEAKLAAVKAIAARRAARRVVFRQQGDRLVPVGITSGRDINASNSMVDDQGRVILTGPVAVVGQGGTTNSTSDAGTSRLLGGRSRRHRGSQGGDSAMDPRLVHMGTDIEELMVMEAMRLSMLDEEERRKKAEKEAKAANKKESKASTWLRKSTGGTSSPLQSTSRRGSVDQGRSSTDVPPAPVAGPSGSNITTIGPSTTVSGPRIGGSTKSQFLKMPPMQRNDSSASMSMANLPPPLVPTRAGGPSASEPASAHVPAPAKLPVVQPHNFD